MKAQRKVRQKNTGNRQTLSIITFWSGKIYVRELRIIANLSRNLEITKKSRDLFTFNCEYGIYIAHSRFVPQEGSFISSFVTGAEVPFLFVFSSSSLLDRKVHESETAYRIRVTRRLHQGALDAPGSDVTAVWSSGTLIRIPHNPHKSNPFPPDGRNINF